MSVALILIGFILKLAPFGKGQKSVKSVLSLVMVMIIVSPLTTVANIDPHISINETSSEINDYSGLIEQTTVSLLKSRIEDVLDEYALAYNYVDITVLNNADKVQITAITVYVNDSKYITKIKTAIRKELQLDVVVAVQGR